MMLASLLLSAALAGGTSVEWSASRIYVAGMPYPGRVVITAGEGGAKLPAWLLTAAAFELGEKPLAPREGEESFHLPEGFTLSGAVDLAPHIPAGLESFELRLSKRWSDAPALAVEMLQRAPKGANFMQMEPEELEKYQVLLRTNRGDMLVRMWPDVAPNTVRNFLDLASIRFYDGLIFHRVIPNMLIQSGDPSGEGTGVGPRRVDAEFSSRRHTPGVLSMARQPTDVNSATSQFFIVYAAASELDGKYTTFGELVWGFDVVEQIVRVSILPGNRPRERQVIEQAIVVLAKGDK